MNESKSLPMILAEWWDERRRKRHHSSNPPKTRTSWLPTPGNVIFVVILVFGLFWAQSVGALNLGASTGTSTSTIAYQGRLADSNGDPLTETLNMGFRLYNAGTGSAPLWTEQWTGSNGVQISDGLFNVMLGSLDPIPQSIITGNENLFLGITVGTDGEMSPRVQLGSVPFAVQALTVPDGSITSAKLASDVSLVPPDGSITTEKIADGAVHSSKLNLMSGTACLSTHAYLHFPGGQFVFNDIPELMLSFTLEKPSKVLIWIDGTAQFTNTDGNAAVEVLVDGHRRLSTIHEREMANWWFNINDQRILDLAAGNHILQGNALSNTTGTMTVFSAAGGNDPSDTCIYYLVLGEQ
ncbi:MAG: hypothetical protein KBG20_15825 [Caldilineaceae bacterium]|nr:hypothetical protein [Caldilineaceae bacterium]MBP8124980.1 hypothetical protein [Caldilineaceae bacterium]MBP9073776.1 hypothetical protein [Caldilineaceae bacterium]